MGYGMNSSTGSREKIPSGYRKASIQQFTPEQMQLLDQMMQHVGPDSYLSKLAGGDQSFFREIEKPALQQFSGLQGSLASRFSGMGMGARRSSGFQNQSTSAASQFAQQLQAQRQGLQRQALMDLSDISNSLMNQRPYQNFLVQKNQDQGSGWGGIAGAGIGAAGGFFLGGPAGAMTGAQLGYGIGNSF